MDLVAEVNVAVSQALGFDPKDVKAITIKIRAGHVPIVKVEMSTLYIQDHPLAETISKFELFGVMEPA